MCRWRKFRRLAILVFLSTATLADANAADGKTPPATGGIMQKGPDIEAAVRSELMHAKARNTREALERFIRRHPGHPLVAKARSMLEDMGSE